MLPTLQTPLATFFPSKKAPKLYLISENRRYCRASVRSCFPSKRTHTLSLSLCLLSFCSAHGREEQHFNSVKHRYYVACFSNFKYKYSRNHSTTIVIILCVFDFIKRLSGFLCRLKSWKGELVIVIMGHVSVTISYSSRCLTSCLTTETVKYINENHFIEDLAASKYSIWAQRMKQKQ